ncbi:hypothetical protein DFJ58DRAFT_620683, partial [Suillus subalutaceus]|uniref:uncharacterized protein n=1 Tax=Suillus subalutaceus TaxID=48586 RepID=UPI001B886D23
TEFSSCPANFYFLPSSISSLTFNHIYARMWDSNTNLQLGTGYFGKDTLPAKSYPKSRSRLINFSYIALNDTDMSWNEWYNAAKMLGFMLSCQGQVSVHVVV